MANGEEKLEVRSVLTNERPIDLNICKRGNYNAIELLLLLYICLIILLRSYDLTYLERVLFRVLALRCRL